VGLPIDDVFPIAYDLRGIAIGQPDALVRTVEKQPRERLSFDERLAFTRGLAKQWHDLIAALMSGVHNAAYCTESGRVDPLANTREFYPS
jgi:hypothetical protein